MSEHQARASGLPEIISLQISPPVLPRKGRKDLLDGAAEILLEMGESGRWRRVFGGTAWRSREKGDAGGRGEGSWAERSVQEWRRSLVAQLRGVHLSQTHQQTRTAFQDLKGTCRKTEREGQGKQW